MDNSLYDQQYTQWKHWDQGYGQLSTQQSAYYAMELANTGLDLRQPLRFLEIGFGQGTLMRYAQQQGWVVQGVEANPDLIVRAQQAGFVASNDVELNTLADQSFDLIVAFDVLEHIPDAQIALVIQKIAHLLAPGGMFLARFPNGDSPLGLIHQHGDPSHVSFIGMGKVRYYSAVSGLHLSYFGAEAMPSLERKLYKKLRFHFRQWLKQMISGVLNWIYTPKMGNIYHSANLVVVLQKQP